MAECLHLYFCLKAGFELKGKVVVVDRDLLDQLPDQPFVVLRHLGGLLRQKGFELIQPLPPRSSKTCILNSGSMRRISTMISSASLSSIMHSSTGTMR